MVGTTPEITASRAWCEIGLHERTKSHGVIRIAVVALSITLAQTATALVISMAAGNGSPADAYRAFCRRDGFMYTAILVDGYRSTIPPTASQNFDLSNVAFFPGYPLAGRLVHKLSGGALSAHVSLVLAAQLAAWGFWGYWLLLLQRLGVPLAMGTLLTLAASLHPAAFFLVVAYSESLFLWGLLGFFYWLASPGVAARWWAAPFGILMTATRLGGLPLAFCPLAVQIWSDLVPRSGASQRLQSDRNTLARLTAIGLLACLGGLAFFAFCQWRFGAWDLYFQTQREGQGVAADWLWFLQPANYAFLGAVFHPHLDWTDDVSRLFVGLTVVALAIVARKELQLAKTGDDGWRERMLFYVCAGVLLFVHAAGVSPRHMQSMIRYCYPVHLLMLLALAQWSAQHSFEYLSNTTRRRVTIGLAASLGLQLALTYRYFQGGWVA